MSSSFDDILRSFSRLERSAPRFDRGLNRMFSGLSNGSLHNVTTGFRQARRAAGTAGRQGRRVVQGVLALVAAACTAIFGLVFVANPTSGNAARWIEWEASQLVPSPSALIMELLVTVALAAFVYVAWKLRQRKRGH